MKLSVRSIPTLFIIIRSQSVFSFTPTSTTSSSSSHQHQLHRLHDKNTASWKLTALPPTQTQTQTSNDKNDLHLLTFDLDDTIFPIDQVVSDANVAQVQALIKYGYTAADNKQIIAASKLIRTELREAGNVVTYSDLRKQSIRREIERLTTARSDASPALVAEGVHDSVIESIFHAWLTERHASADRNLFPHASSALQRIREQHPNAIIGAITNGRGNPLQMPNVADYFDFCVSGEDVGVFPRRKPDRGIYEAAIQTFHGLQQEQGNNNVEKMESLCWLHVGDDLANDVGASAACGAKSIWFTMEDDDEEEESGGESQQQQPMWSTATKEELEKRAAMDDLAREHVSAKICSLKELPDAIVNILSQ